MAWCFQELKNEDVYVVSSGVEGPTVAIFGGVHGNEVCGVEAIKEVLSSNFRASRGKVIFVFANRLAIDRNVRFVEENLNRCFVGSRGSTYEGRLARDLKKIMYDSDVLLDIHSSFSRCSEPFIICERNAFKYIKLLPFNKVCSGFDRIEPGGTDYFMNRIGRIGICVECGYLADPMAKEIAVTSIYSLLASLGMIANKAKGIWDNKEFFEVRYLHKVEIGRSFVLRRSFRDFERIKKGELIGFCGDREVLADRDGFILFARSVGLSDKDREAFLLGD